MSSKQRLDIALEQRGLLPSRARARDAILRGTVMVNAEPARKPNQKVFDTDSITLNDPAARYVSRAALKLIAGLDIAKIDVEQQVCLDVGASTGGFTQVLLERGAAQVYAVDVGHDQLHETLKSDARVTWFEGFNAREISTTQVPLPIDILVSDLSFVSVIKVLEEPLTLCADKSFVIILIKPQFEVGKEHVGKGGIVTDQDAVDRSVRAVIDFVEERGFTLKHTTPSPIAGGDGNVETIAVFAKKAAGFK